MTSLRPLADIEQRLRSIDARPAWLSSPPERPSVDLILSSSEISFQHGSGTLLHRILDEAGPFVTLRSRTSFGGLQSVSPVAEAVVPDEALGSNNRSVLGSFAINWLSRWNVRSILCVPYYPEDFHLAEIAKACTGAPLIVYVMDDQVLLGSNVSTKMAARLFDLADARFAISQEMRNAYESAFRKKFWMMPPVVAARFHRSAPSEGPRRSTPVRGVMLGHCWSSRWLEKLCETVRGSNIRIRWLPPGRDMPWLQRELDFALLEEVGIDVVFDADHDGMIAEVVGAHFAVLPSGLADDTGFTNAIARYSFPSRIPFVMASAGTPLLVLGGRHSAAARVVKRLGIGEAVDYAPSEFVAAAACLSSPEKQREIRSRAFDLAPSFVASGAWEALQQSVAADMRPKDDRFERLFVPRADEFRYFVDAPLPGDIHPDYAAAFQAFDRLRVQGYRPDFILDVGASIGVWALTIRRLYPEARTILCDPLFSRYHPRPLTEGCEIVEQALMDRVGETTFKVSKDLLNSSVLAVAGVSDVDEEIRIPATTVDALIAKMGVGGRGILKIDVQFAEHLVIAGAEKALREQIDFVVLELTLQPPNTDAKSMLEMIELMRTYGFDYSDDVGEWRSPVSGFLEQKDVLFIRRGISL